MQAQITNGIRVCVEPFYQEGYSIPINNKYVFSYRITIENLSSQTVQLLRRHWYIVDADLSQREVEGEGVIGKKPTLRPGETHEYASWTQITYGIGKMYGTYLMTRKEDDSHFQVKIPVFQLVAPCRLN